MAAWSRKRKALVALAGLIILSGIVALNLLREGRGKSWAKDIQTVRVKQGRVVEQLKETGWIVFVRTVEVKSTVSGEIVQLLADAGDLVEEGQTLAIVEPDPNQTLQLYNKRADVDRAQIDLEQIRRDGYDLSREEVTDGAFALAAPILARTRCAVAAISVSGPKFRLTPDWVPRFKGTVLAACRKAGEVAGSDLVPMAL